MNEKLKLIFLIQKDYELKHDTYVSEKNTAGMVYLIMHGDQGKTGKIELNDGSFENNAKDDFFFSAPDVGKISKIELFYTPTLKNNGNSILIKASTKKKE